MQLYPLLCGVVNTSTPLPPVLVSPSTPSFPLSSLSSHCPIKDAPPLPLLPHQEVLSSFSHKPALSLLDRYRWPGSIEHQAPEPSFLHVLPWVQRFLTAREHHSLCHLSHSSNHGWQFGPLCFYRPWKPIRRQCWGFGIPTLNRRIIADSPPINQLIHFIWQFLEPRDRRACADASILWNFYAKVRAVAVLAPVSTLRKLRLPPHKPNTLCPSRCLLYASTLLHFHFVYSGFIRWLSGEYTNHHRNWDNTHATLQQACVCPPAPSLPPVSFSRCKRASTQGVPLQGTYFSPKSEMRTRNQYNNHPAVTQNVPAVIRKFAAEEEKIFHLHLPCSFIFFIEGLMLNPLLMGGL